MRLVDLEAHWWVSAEHRQGMGVIFWCPHCRQKKLGVAFANPVDGGPPEHLVHPDVHGSPPEWTRTGDSLETLTLTPSVDASQFGHWHGFITNGEIT